MSHLRHTPGTPVRDSTGRHTLGPGDQVLLRASGGVGWQKISWLVCRVDFTSGNVELYAAKGRHEVAPGAATQLLRAAARPSLPADGLEGMTVQAARQLVARVASDYGRRPVPATRYDLWVLARTWGRRVYGHRGLLFGPRERVLVTPQRIRDVTGERWVRWAFCVPQCREVLLLDRQLTVE